MQVSPTIWTHIRDRAQADIKILSQSSTAFYRTFCTAAIAGLLLTSMPTLADIPMVAPKEPVFDEAGIVQRGSIQLFSTAVTNIESKEGVKVRFVFVKNVPYGETPDEYAKELAGEWGLNEKDVLFVASPKLARAGVFVGNKAAERLTPEIAESIANETYAVAAGDERYSTALLDVSNRLIPVLTGETDPGPPELKSTEVVQTYKTKKETAGDRNKYVTVVVVILVISVVAPLLQTYWYVKDD